MVKKTLSFRCFFKDFRKRDKSDMAWTYLLGTCRNVKAGHINSPGSHTNIRQRAVQLYMYTLKDTTKLFCNFVDLFI